MNNPYNLYLLFFVLVIMHPAWIIQKLKGMGSPTIVECSSDRSVYIMHVVAYSSVFRDAQFRVLDAF